MNNILWGAATCAYQVEGAVYNDGKGLTNWDVFYDKNNLGYDGKVAVDHYHHWREDVKLFHEIGLQTYRLSISWARILPNGRGEINQAGLKFYHELIDELIAYGIKPFVTIYHWDLPQALALEGGWLNRSTIKAYLGYCRILFDEFGDKVFLWGTINEPMSEVIESYVQGTHPPQIKNDYKSALQVSHHFNVASASAIKLYRDMKLKGKIGIVLNPMPCDLLDDTPDNRKALKFARSYLCDWYVSPATLGQYPDELLKYSLEKFQSPEIQSGDIELMQKNIGDYLGINYYMRRVVKANNLQNERIENKFSFVRVPDGEYTEWGWEIYPQGLKDLLLYITEHYREMEFIIAENGMGFRDKINEEGEFIDDERIDYLKRHIDLILQLVNSRAVNVAAYYVWSAIDLLSWTNGYQKRYGLIGVDYQTLERKLKKSAHWYHDFIKLQENK
ncbi:glycoside hydrolase family 1 protein [Amygdalobacter nucleatus]|uniref:glycoside hydrolase family 1 protein n=1 Tax=Amygdalobacter nucleatus TaxID=3029274 RepID=UPI0027994758|nr:glycoside hydrolase family 1 protein [Amygdalobacter nucleatus]WEG37141.1 glycoside hydrolase family 1 protein [Amygdalobacter nucleatus]